MGSLYDGLAAAQTASQRAYLDAEQAAYEEQIAELEEALDECQNPTPPPVTGTAFGSSVNGPLFTTLGYDTVPITRVYLQNLPPGSTWDGIVGRQLDYPIGAEALRALPGWSPLRRGGDVRGIAGDSGATNDLADGVAYSTGALWLSWKEEDPARVDAFLDTMPDDLGLDVWGTFHHEPENDAPGFSAAKFCDLFAQHAPVCRAHDVLSVPILMRYTFSPDSGRDWHDWWPGAEHVDVFGCDSYNTANKKGAYSDPQKQMAPIYEAAASVDKPWAIGEIGASIFNGKSQPRVDWMNGIRDVCAANDCLAAAWWDQDAYKFDQPAADAWCAP